jgi:hypothetical protein
MEELIKQLSAKTGIARDKAEQVGQCLKEHAIDVPQWISGDASKLASLLTEKTGLAKADAEKVVGTIKSQGGEWMKALGQQGSGMAQKAKDAVGGLFGKK